MRGFRAQDLPGATSGLEAAFAFEEHGFRLKQAELPEWPSKAPFKKSGIPDLHIRPVPGPPAAEEPWPRAPPAFRLEGAFGF